MSTRTHRCGSHKASGPLTHRKNKLSQNQTFPLTEEFILSPNGTEHLDQKVKRINPLTLRFCSFISYYLPFVPTNTTSSLPCLHSEGVRASFSGAFVRGCIILSASRTAGFTALPLLFSSLGYKTSLVLHFLLFILGKPILPALKLRSFFFPDILPSYCTQASNDITYLFF